MPSRSPYVNSFPHRPPSDRPWCPPRPVPPPGGFLALGDRFTVPGIVDHRPTSHARGGTPWSELRKGAGHA